jgi:hypothetical protein
MQYFFDMSINGIKNQGFSVFGNPGLVVSSIPYDNLPKLMLQDAEKAIEQANPNIINLESIAIFYRASNNYRDSEKTKLTLADELKPADLESLNKQYFYIVMPLKKIQ